jgi:acylphosphatase
MRIHSPPRRTFHIAASMTFILVAIAAFPERTGAKGGQNITAVSGKVTGNVQQVGFRAMIQKQAIEYNLAGSTENNPDKTVRFTLQGDGDQIKQALKAINKGTKKSSNVNVSTSPGSVDSNLKTFTIVGWTSVSRNITHPYDLVFTLRDPDTAIKKKDVKAVWLKICEAAVQGADKGKCDKDKDDEE